MTHPSPRQFLLTPPQDLRRPGLGLPLALMAQELDGQGRLTQAPLPPQAQGGLMLVGGQPTHPGGRRPLPGCPGDPGPVPQPGLCRGSSWTWSCPPPLPGAADPLGGGGAGPAPGHLVPAGALCQLLPSGQPLPHLCHLRRLPFAGGWRRSSPNTAPAGWCSACAGPGGLLPSRHQGVGHPISQEELNRLRRRLEPSVFSPPTSAPGTSPT